MGTVKPTPRHRAVLFDLFNTLVPGGSREERDEVSRRMAEAVGVEPATMAGLIRSTFDNRTRGRCGDLRQTMVWLAGELGATPSPDAVQAALELRLEMTRSLHSRTWALPALIELGRVGVLRAIVSDCSAETPTIWAESPLSSHLEAVSFSCQTGHRKPEPEAYLVAVARLGVDPSECLFVGDGGSHELAGATELGMTAIRFIPPIGARGESIDEDTAWSGHTISDLIDLVALFE